MIENYLVYLFNMDLTEPIYHEELNPTEPVSNLHVFMPGHVYK